MPERVFCKSTKEKPFWKEFDGNTVELQRGSGKNARLFSWIQIDVVSVLKISSPITTGL